MIACIAAVYLVLRHV